MCNCWHTSPKHRPMFIEIANDLKNFSRLYSNDEETGTLSSDSAFYLNHQPDHLQSSPQAFHYNDNKDMSYLLTVPITAADAVSLTFSALGSTDDLDQVGRSCTEDENKQQDGRSSADITSETRSSICSPEEPLSTVPHINIAPPDLPCGDEQQSMVANRVPLRNEPPVNKFLLKANRSQESIPDFRYSLFQTHNIFNHNFHLMHQITVDNICYGIEETLLRKEHPLLLSIATKRRKTLPQTQIIITQLYPHWGVKY